MKYITYLVFFFFSVNITSAQTINYGYDSLGRLTKVEYPDSCSINYTYDASGNRMSSIITNLCFSSPKPTITPSGPVVFCAGDSVTLTSSASANYLWSTGEKTKKIVVKKPGKYAVTALLSSTCSKLSDSITITVNPRPKAAITASKSVLCVGDVVELKAETANNQTYKWSTGSTATSILVNTTGIYKLFVTNSFGCIDSASTSLTFNSLPVVITGGDKNLCEYSKIGVQLGSTAITGNTYSWSPVAGLDNAILSNPTANPSTTTTYTLKVTTAYGCISAASAKVTMLPTPTAPTVGVITQPTCAKVTGSVVLNGLPPTGNWILTRTPGDVTTNGTGISLTVSGLIPYTYNYTVTGTSGCPSVPSANVVIDLQPKIPIIPIANAATNFSQTYLMANWNSSATATGYRLDVSDNIGFTTFLPGYQNKDVSNVLSYSITGLTAFKSYYYRVRSYNICGTGSDSGIITATTLPNPPVAPTPIAASSIVQTNFTANWNPSTSATGYRLDVATNPGFTTFVTGFNDKDMNNVTTISITGLTANTTYYYRIRAYNTGGISASSGTITTTTLPNPPETPIANLASNIIQTSFSANWNSSATATGYRLDVSTSTAFTTFVTGYNDKDVSNVTTTSITGLTENKTYFYRVRAYNTGGNSLSSGNITTTTLPNPPVAPVANPATIVVQNSFNANWSPSPTATGYRIDVATNIGFTAYLSGYNDKDIGNATSFPIIGLTARTTYFYRLRAYNSGGTSSGTNTITVNTLSMPPNVPTGLAATSCNNQVTLSWRQNSDPYFGRYRIFGGLTSNPTTKMDSTTNSASDTLKIISGLVSGQTYFFQVKAVNDDGPESTFSTQSSVKVKTGLLPIIKSKWSDVLICYNIGDSIKKYQWYKGSSLIPNAINQYYTTKKSPGVYSVETIDKEGCKNISSPITISGTKSISVSPNPASVSFELRIVNPSEEKADVSIINSAGVKVMEFQAQNVKDEVLKAISVSHLADGVYVVQVLLNDELLSTKILVKK